MNEMEIKAKARELAQDTQWMEALNAAQTTAEAAKIFAQKGIEVTAEELDQLVEAHNDGELDPTTLDEVSGGLPFVLACAGVMLAASVIAYGSAYAFSRETASWNKKKKK